MRCEYCSRDVQPNSEGGCPFCGAPLKEIPAAHDLWDQRWKLPSDVAAQIDEASKMDMLSVIRKFEEPLSRFQIYFPLFLIGAIIGGCSLIIPGIRDFIMGSFQWVASWFGGI